MSTLIAFAAETEELAPLLMPAPAFAGIAAGVFVALAVVVWSFRDVSHRQNAALRGDDSSSSVGH